MRKPTKCLGENKGADQLYSNWEAAVTAKLISPFVFATQIEKYIYLFSFNSKFQASSLLLRLYRPVRVGPDRNPNCWFSHTQAHLP